MKKTDQEWQSLLTPEQYRICRRKGTEASFSGELTDNHLPGEYLCVCCKNSLFESTAKYDSGTGWPSFWQPITQTAVTEKSGSEVVCQRCEAHLGHVFKDGPKPTGLRYCINSTALEFIKINDK